MPLYSPIMQRNSQDEKKYRTLTLVSTKSCNLQCKYCYEKHDLRDNCTMDFDVAKNAISDHLNRDDDFDFVCIDIFGGEPLMVFPFIKQVFEWCRGKKWKKRYLFMVATNGTLLTDEMKEWFTRNKKHITMALSIDGNRTAHNINRNDSYDQVSPHLNFFKNTWPDQPAKMTISDETIPYVADSVIELEEFGLYFTANLPLENIWGNETNKKKLLEIYNEQLMRLVDYYVENSHLYPVYPLLGILPAESGIPELKIATDADNDCDCVRFCGAGHEMIVVDVDGQNYPCHRFLPWVTGKNEKLESINRQNVWKPDECNNCAIVQSCPTCAGYNWEVSGDTGIRTAYHCEAHKLEVLAAAQIAAQRLGKIPITELKSLSPAEYSTMHERVKTLLNMINNGI